MAILKCVTISDGVCMCGWGGALNLFMIILGLKCVTISDDGDVYVCVCLWH